MDTLFLPCGNVPLSNLFEPHPVETDCFLYAHVEQNKTDSVTCLCMITMSKDLDTLNGMDVPIVDSLYDYIVSSSVLFLDANNDIIVSYWCRQKYYMLHVGLDGTVHGPRGGGVLPSNVDDAQAYGDVQCLASSVLLSGR